MTFTNVPNLHICFVAPFAYPLLAGEDELAMIGGAELQQVIVARALAARGYRVSMICLNFGQNDQIIVDGITVYRAFRPNEGLPVLRFLWPRLATIWNCLYRVNADIYYHRTAGMLTGVMAAFCRRHGGKSVFAAAGNPDLERNTPRIRYARDRRIYEYGLRNVDLILVQNEEQARLCQLNFGRNSIHVPNCSPIAYYPPKDAGHLVLWVSTIRSLKRPDLFLELAEALPSYQFRMVGGPDQGEAKLYKTIEARAKTIPNIEFIGFVPFTKIDEHFREASVFVNTSDSEGFPNTFMQAWAQGVPTVSFVDSGARAEGQAVGQRVQSISEMVDCVSRWLENPSERNREGAKCREYLIANHSPDRVLDIYEKIFSNLVRRVPE